jgi:hypothetical protein
MNLVKVKRGRGGGETTQTDEMAMYYLNGLGLPTSPHVTLNFADKEFTAVADSGAEVCWLSEEMHEDVTAAGLPALELTI